jgi:hypothetical protein
VQPLGQREQLVAVGARVGGDAGDAALAEQVPLVVEHRHVAEVDPGHRERAAGGQCGERRRHQGAHRGEQDGGVEVDRRAVVRVADR